MDRIILLDGSSIMYRAYYATIGKQIMQTSKGLYTNALVGFINMIENIISDDYTHILVCFDTKKPTFRHKMYKDYKASRKPMPEELEMQIPLIKEYLKIRKIKYTELEGYEADDIIGTFSKMGKENNIKVDIYSSDRDLIQLVSDNTTVHMMKSGVVLVESYTLESLKQKHNFTPKQFLYYKAIMGDNSDNIPGIPGCGKKRSKELVLKYENLENLFLDSDNIKGKLGENIRKNKELVYKSLDLVTINKNIPIPLKIDDITKKETNLDEFISFCQKYEMHYLAEKLEQTYKEDKNYNFDFIEINSDNDILKYLKNKELYLYLEFENPNYHTSKIWGLGCFNGNKTFYLSENFIKKSKELKNILTNQNTKINCYDYKSIYVFFNRLGIKINNPTFDLMLAAYLISPSQGSKEFTKLAIDLGYLNLSYDETIFGKGAKRKFIESSQSKNHIASKAKAIFFLKPTLINKLKEYNQIKLFTDLELPLSRVLAKMEISGLTISINELERQKKLLANNLTNLKENIHLLAGETFNINSPKQLGEILFNKLNLPVIKKTKTGYSTNQEVLEQLTNNHSIINEILNYRQLAKLFQTYIMGLEETILNDNKVHTIYQQALTQTGRLSSTEPNLQNIPTRTKEGREIRKIFTIENKNNYLLTMDYSQIELRVLAHVSNSKTLIDVFNKDGDIHTKTAQDIFQTTEITKEMRSSAKTINFGIIYGMSAWRLAKDINVSVKDAEAYIKKYLNKYPEVNNYLKNVVIDASKNGYVKTIMNRRRDIPELKNKNHAIKKLGERLALNTPIQGGAADIIKVAMIKIDEYIEKNNYKTKMLLQVHDELLFEVPENELEIMKEKLPEIMVNAVKLNVDLKVSLSYGKNWFEL